jgi:hypothetical protein
VGPYDRARLRVESSNDRAAASTGSVFSPESPSSRAPYPGDGARPATVAEVSGRDAPEVTITNRTWFTMQFRLSDGVSSRDCELRPAESTSVRGLGNWRIAYHDGRGWSVRSLKPGQNYQFVDVGGVFLLERAW